MYEHAAHAQVRNFDAERLAPFRYQGRCDRYFGAAEQSLVVVLFHIAPPERLCIDDSRGKQKKCRSAVYPSHRICLNAQITATEGAGQ
jgi:hypothetical protein